MYRHDQDTKRFLAKTESILIKQQSNIKHLLAEIGKYKQNVKGSLAKILGANVFAVGSEMLAFQILKNLEKSFLLLSLIGLRVLVENYLNVHYIYHHPKHAQDNKWAEELCNDYLDRTKNTKAMKSKLGKVSLYKRAKSVGLEEFYNVVYSELCNYSHFLADIIDVIHPTYFKAKTIQTAIYVVTCYQDILIAIASFFNCSFEIFIEEILVYKKEGEQILASINMKNSQVDLTSENR
ncbi:hypothetical protein KAX02_12300 [candidate division WOR-3 bacterium]|nr:hypothetical protein [candidate division WOR-3 bacterium]